MNIININNKKIYKFYTKNPNIYYKQKTLKKKSFISSCLLTLLLFHTFLLFKILVSLNLCAFLPRIFDHTINTICSLTIVIWTSMVNMSLNGSCESEVKLVIFYINSISISLLRWHISRQINRLEYQLIHKFFRNSIKLVRKIEFRFI